jgi:hypothetical protein
MIGSYDPEGSKYLDKLSLVDCSSAESFEVPIVSVSIDGSPVALPSGKRGFIIDPAESLIAMDAFDLSKIKATLETLFTGAGFKCATSPDPTLPDCFFEKPCSEVDPTLIGKFFEISMTT